MIEITLANVPSQSFTIQLEECQYSFVVRSVNANDNDSGIIAVDILQNNIPIVTGNRAVAGYFLMPYRYQEDDDCGNFVFFTLNDDLPDYTQFGITQSLIYFTKQELQDARA
jgi:hypothetical protein